MLTSDDTSQAEHLYRWHIDKRTGGREPGSWKQNTNDYVDACRQLLFSMNEFGFDPDHPIVLGSNQRLRDGAHRIACTMALGINLRLINAGKPSSASPWGAEWFITKGLSYQIVRGLETDCRSLML